MIILETGFMLLIEVSGSLQSVCKSLVLHDALLNNLPSWRTAHLRGLPRQFMTKGAMTAALSIYPDKRQSRLQHVITRVGGFPRQALVLIDHFPTAQGLEWIRIRTQRARPRLNVILLGCAVSRANIVVRARVL